jgi:hypothetical protein
MDSKTCPHSPQKSLYHIHLTFEAKNVEIILILSNRCGKSSDQTTTNNKLTPKQDNSSGNL